MKAGAAGRAMRCGVAFLTALVATASALAADGGDAPAIRRADRIEGLLADRRGPVPGTRVRLLERLNAPLMGRVLARRARGESDWSVRGKLDGGGEFQLVRHGAAIVGNIHPEHGAPLEIRMDPLTGRPVTRAARDAAHAHCALEDPSIRRALMQGRIRRLPPGAIGRPDPLTDRLRSTADTGADTGAAALGQGIVGTGGTFAEADNGVYVDVLVLYTPAAQVAAGGHDGLFAVVQLAIDTTNEAYAASGIGHRLRLAGCRSVAYSETGGTMLQHVQRLRSTSDGVMDEVHDWRDDYGADIVSLLVDDTDPVGGSETFGIAFSSGSPFEASQAFNVVDQAYAASATNWTFAHETGHNLGAGHDTGDTSGALYPYAIGHLLTGNTQGLARTIMVRRSRGGERLRRFSNPSLTWDGQPTGVATIADLATAFDISDSFVAGYRPELPGTAYLDFDAAAGGDGTAGAPYSTLADAIAGVRWGGTIVLQGGSTVDGAIGVLNPDRPFTLRADGADVTLD